MVTKLTMSCSVTFVTLFELKENPAYINVDQRLLSSYARPYELAGEM